MSWLASLGSSAMSMASGLSLHDATGGWSDFSSRQSAAKYQSKQSANLMRLQYELEQQSLRDSPSAYRAGLEQAGYNPMLALPSGLSTPTVGLGSGGSMASSDGSSKPFEGLAKMTRESAVKQLENLEKTGKNLDASTAKQLSEASESIARAEKVKKESDSIDPVTERENQRYGRSHGNQQLLDLTRFISDWWDGRLHPSSSPSSAEGVKVMNDAAKAVQEERRRRVREGLAHPRRKGRR